jgi:hypothetical protein
MSRYLNFDDAKLIIQGNAETARRVTETALQAAFRLSDEALGPLRKELRPLLSAETFNGEDAEAGSLLRELIPMVASMIIFGESMTGLALGLYTDNSGVPRVTKQGSSYPKIQALARAFTNCSLKQDVVALTFWIPREEVSMVLADKASRITDKDDYILTQSGFDAFFAAKSYGWPTPAWDLCASRRNAKVERFWSQTYSEGCSGVSVCDTCWPSTGSLYIFPPIKLLPRVLARAISHKGDPTLLVLPIWPSSPFFTTICPDGKHLREEVKAWRYVDRYELKDGVSSTAFFTKKQGQPLQGHKNMFIMVAIWTDAPREGQYKSQYGKKFCLLKHLNSRKKCTQCEPK